MSASTPSGPPPAGPPGGPPPGPPAGPPTGRTPPPAGNGGASGPALLKTTAGRQMLLIVGVVIALVVGLVVASVTKNSGSSAPPAPHNEVFLTAAGARGQDPFTPSVTTTSSVGAATTTTTSPPPTTTPAVPTAYSGATIGLYGGTQNLSTCDSAQMIRYLTQNPSLGNAWAQAQGIPYAGLASYIQNLTPVVLRGDTLVTNHGYSNGVAYPIVEVLQAGTAVLVDSYGVPRARCFCGNPLTPAPSFTAPPTYTGPRWSSFSPATVVLVQPSPTVINTYTVVDTGTGQAYPQPAAPGRPPGATSPPTTRPAIPTTTTPTTTTTLPPGLTGPGNVYTLTFSGQQTIGHWPSGGECAETLVQQGDVVNGSFVTSGSSIVVKFSNAQLSGTYAPASGSFTATSSTPETVAGSTGSVDLKMTGTLTSNALTGAMFTELLQPGGLGCSWTVSGTKTTGTGSASGSTTTSSTTSTTRPPRPRR